MEEQHMSPQRRITLGAVLLALAIGFVVTSACVPESASVAVVVSTPPPAARVEVIGTAPGPDYVWIGGHWGWHGTEYVWVDGRWDRGPHAKAKWVPGHWKHTSRGYVWQEGHWK
jgi:hypothetical protein